MGEKGPPGLQIVELTEVTGGAPRLLLFQDRLGIMRAEAAEAEVTPLALEVLGGLVEIMPVTAGEPEQEPEVMELQTEVVVVGAAATKVRAEMVGLVS